jgi:regulator of sirC expression with transglutaminase-like and TPR domain
MRLPPAPLAALALALALAAPAAAQPVRDPQTCEALAEASPARAVEAAREWVRFGGGAPAAICEVLALEQLGALTTAARRLETLAREAPAETYGEAARAALLELAAGFLLRDSAPEAALQAADRGLALTPSDPALLRRRAEALADLDRPAEALPDLNQALAAEPDNLSARLLRARLRRESGSPEGALADARAAVALAPDDPRTHLAQGAAEAALGDRAAARESLLKTIGLDREGPIGAEARRILQRMETE